MDRQIYQNISLIAYGQNSIMKSLYIIIIMLLINCHYANSATIPVSNLPDVMAIVDTFGVDSIILPLNPGYIMDVLANDGSTFPIENSCSNPALSIIEQPTQGFVVLDSTENCDRLKYIHTGAAGWDSLQYAVCDSLNLCDTTSIFLKIYQPLDSLDEPVVLNELVFNNSETFTTTLNSQCFPEWHFSDNEKKEQGRANTGLNGDIVALPIEPIYFTALPDNIRGSINLSWEVTIESTVDRFIVEYSRNAIDFTELAVISYTENRWNYAYTHEDAQPSMRHYYRLKMVKPDGKINYSDIEEVSLLRSDHNPVFIHPNPTYEATTVKFESSTSENGQLMIYDSFGCLMAQQNILIQEGSNKLFVNVNGLSAGIYILKLLQEEYRWTGKFIKM